jgi:hypothetical protein
MAAAPNLPIPEPGIPWTVVIDDNFNATPPGLIVSPGDTVDFENESGVDITVQFAANYTGTAVYPNMSLPVPDGSTVGFTAPNTDAAANYNIYVNGVQENEDPFVIQVGVGPLYVVLDGATTYNFPTAAVPLGDITTGMGRLFVGPNDPSSSLGIRFTSNPFNPPMTTNDGPHPVQAGTTPGSYGYTVVSPNENPGPGTVIIRNT